MANETCDPVDLGWNNFFLSQLDPTELAELVPARVVSVDRSLLHVLGGRLAGTVRPFAMDEADDESRATVGDWLLLAPGSLSPVRLLARKSLFKRRAAGTGRKLQLIAANVDTLFIVSSCNLDFNIARLERYLALARQAEVMPVVVLTKADLADDPHAYIDAASRLLSGLVVEVLDARDQKQARQLEAWCGRGQTVALVGSSGVGKSTLVNTLTGGSGIATGAIRVDDDKGRHTTSARMLHRLPAGGWLLDTPGMRELQLADAEQGIEVVFEDLVILAASCRFSDCCHETEPGCAIRAAMEAGQLDERRFRRWRKLLREEALNTRSLAERRQEDRAFGKMVKRHMQDKQRRRDP